MRVKTLLCAALVAAIIPAAARADDPNDPTQILAKGQPGRSAAARARDHAAIRQLNLDELARTQARDAQLAGGWQAWRDAREAGQRADYVPQAEYERASQDYARRYADYERRMAQWRRAVAACRAGDTEACAN